MKEFKKLLALAMVFILGISLVACGGNNGDQNNSTSENVPSESTGTLEGIKKSGKLVVGTSADYPPYEFHAMIDGKDQIVGFDMNIAKAVADDLGVELEIQDLGFDAALQAVQTGLVDLGIGGINPTPDRQEAFEISDIYYTAEYVALISKDKMAEFNELSDLDGKEIGVQTASVQEGFVNENLKPGSLLSLPKITDLVIQLNSGLIDAIILEKNVAESYVKANPELAMANIDFSNEDIEGGSAVIASKGNTELMAEVNKTLKRLIEDGSIDKWYLEAVEQTEYLVEME